MDVLEENVLTQNDHGPIGNYGFNWGSVLDPLRLRFHDGGNFFRSRLRPHDEDQEDSLEEELSSSGVAGAGATYLSRAVCFSANE